MIGDYPLLELFQGILLMIPYILLNPQYIVLYAVVLYLVYSQHKRIAGLEEMWYGRVLHSPKGVMLSAMGYGLLGGILGSFILVTLGITISRTDIIYLWPLAIILMFVHPRFICFSYSGGILALAYLIFGYPEINVPGVIGLVAVLHLIEAILVYLSGDEAKTPVYVRVEGEVVGAHLLQRFWPVPVTILIDASLTVHDVESSTAMPDWWPLIGPVGGGSPDLLLLMLPVIAALGYGDMAMSRISEVKVRESAIGLLLFSLGLLGLAIWAAFWSPAMWLAALAAPLGHELMIYLGKKREFQGAPRFGRQEGVLVVAVLSESEAESLGFMEGDIIKEINDEAVNTPEEIEAILSEGFLWKFRVLRGQQELLFHMHGYSKQCDNIYRFGLIPIPKKDDDIEVVDWQQRLFPWFKRNNSG